MTEFKKTLIKTIKSYKEPPWDKHDIYYTRYPWNLLGGVSSGICERWYWYTDDMIDAKCNVDVLVYASKLLKEG